MQLIEQLYHPELAFLPIGDLYTMSPREAALACRLLQARKVDPDALRHLPAAHRHARTSCANASRGLGTEVWPLEPGKTVEW